MHSVSFSATTYRECRRELMEFRNANRDTIRDERYFDWRYSDRPGQSEPIIVWAHGPSSERIGSLSLIPHGFSVNGAPGAVGLLGDISIDKQWRGRRIGKSMFEYLLSLESVKSLTACAVLPNAEAAGPLSKAGWKPVSALNRHVKLMDAECVLAGRIKPRALRAAVTPVVNLVLRFLSCETYLRDLPGHSGEPLEALDRRFDALWTSIDKKGVIMARRDREDLQWRVLEHPLLKYRVFGYSAGEKLGGYIIFHIDRRTCYIDDMLSLGEKGYAARTLALFLGYLRKSASACSVVYRCNENDLTALPLKKFGFLRRSDSQQFMVALTGGAGQSMLLNGRKWFLTSGDKDV